MTDHDKVARSAASARRALGVVFVVASCVLLAAASSGCYLREVIGSAPTGTEPLMHLQTPGSVWWTGGGSHAVLQAVGEDGRPLIVVWNRASGKTRTYRHYRVVDVEPHAPRFWVVPDSRPVPLGVNRDTARPRILDIAGDGIDSRPDELYVVRLDEDGKTRSDVDARWAAWNGVAGYSASVEIDVNKGACPSTLRFYVTAGSLNAWSAKVPTDVVTFEPVGWSPSGRFFAVITQADESATVPAVAAWTSAHGASAASDGGSAEDGQALPLPDPPTWDADIPVFAAADGSLAARQKVTVPVLDANGGASLAAWSGPGDNLLYFHRVDERPTLGALQPLAEIEAIDPFSLDSSQPPRSAWFAGLDKKGLLIARSGGSEGAGGGIRIWRMSAGSGPVEVGPVRGGVTARWSPEGGMLSLAGYGPTELAWVVHRSKTVGGVQTTAFATPGPQDPVFGE